MEEEGEEEEEYDEEKEAAAVLAEVQSESAQISVNVARYTVTVGTAAGVQAHTGIAPLHLVCLNTVSRCWNLASIWSSGVNRCGLRSCRPRLGARATRAC